MGSADLGKLSLEFLGCNEAITVGVNLSESSHQVTHRRLPLPPHHQDELLKGQGASGLGPVMLYGLVRRVSSHQLEC